MASSYTGLGIEKMTTGENAGTWGSKTNTNLQIVEQLLVVMKPKLFHQQPLRYPFLTDQQVRSLGIEL